MKRPILLDDTAVVLYADGAPEALHAAALQLYSRAKAQVAALGVERVDADGEVHRRRWRFVFGEEEDDRSLRQNRFLWGVVYRQISERAQVNGQRYTAEAWHELFKRQFLGFEVIKAPVAGRKRTTVYRRLRSTTGLTVKQMSEYLDQVIAFASTDLGLTLELDPAEREATRYRPKARKREAVAA